MKKQNEVHKMADARTVTLCGIYLGIVKAIKANWKWQGVTCKTCLGKGKR
jgi:hypothetical protein